MSDANDIGGQVDTLDVRIIPPPQRHPLIFQRFAALPAGGAFVLINDHDPKPLYYQLSFEYSGQLGWEYLEQGPRVWRVCVSRTATTSGVQRRIPLRPAASAEE
ncbi:MAG: DUF2249 domain-containing protein [Ktedonobacterales bacterium]